jgi:hypothetical protein
MVSRRRILSRSRDDLNLDNSYPEEEDDVWHIKEKLYKVSERHSNSVIILITIYTLKVIVITPKGNSNTASDERGDLFLI